MLFHFSVYGAGVTSEGIEIPQVLTMKMNNSYEKLSLIEEDISQNLIERIDFIKESIKKYVILNEEVLEESFYKKSRCLLKLLSVSLGSVGGLPFISLANRAAGDIEYLKWIYIFGTFISDGFSTSWAVNNAVTYLTLEPVPLTKQSISKNQRILPFLKHLVVNTISLLDSIPLTYVAYTYNDQKIYSVLTFFSAYSYKLCGYYKLIDNYSFYKRSNENKVQDYYLSLLKKVFPIILSLKTDKRDVLLRELYADKGIDVFLFMQKLIDVVDENKEKENKLHKSVNCVLQVAASPLYIANAFKNAILAYNGMKFVTHSDVFSGFSSCTSTLSSFALNFYVTHKTINAISNALFSNTHNVTFTNTFFPKTRYFLPLISLTLAGLSSWSFSFITYDTLDHSFFQKAAIFFTITTALGAVIIDSFAMRDLTDETVMLCRKYIGTKEEIRLLEVKESLDKFYKIISNMTFEEIILFKSMLTNYNLQNSNTKQQDRTEQEETEIDSNI